MSRKPNVLFILTDQWRASALGIDREPVVRTPNLDQLASEGIHATRAYAANPICTPNRSCLLTGRHSHQTGMITNDLMLPPAEVCFPELFRDAGYATHYIGKWHVDGDEKPGYVPPGWRRRGLETFEGFNRGHEYHRHWGFDNNGGQLPWELGGDPYYEPTLQTELAIQYMQRQGESPFLCYLSLGPPHTPFVPPHSFDRYPEAEIQLPPNVPEAHEAQATEDLSGYYGLCESLDHEVGRLMQFLEESGLAENTLVVFTSDHGDLNGSHGKYRKAEPEEESLRVPLIMRFPGRIEPQSTTDTLFSSIDMMPTLLDLCDMEDPGTATGRSLAGALTPNRPSPSNEAVYCQSKLQNREGEEWRCLVTPTHKLTLRGLHAEIEKLVNLQEDPYEMENLAGTNPSLENELLDRLTAEAKKTGDPYPAPATAAKKLYSDAEAAQART